MKGPWRALLGALPGAALNLLCRERAERPKPALGEVVRQLTALVNGNTWIGFESFSLCAPAPAAWRCSLRSAALHRVGCFVREQFRVGGAGCTWGRTASEPGKSFAPFPRVCGSSFLLYEAQIADDGEQPLSGGRFGGARKIKKRIKFILVPIHLR
jgi:hypothetical protein